MNLKVSLNQACRIIKNGGVVAVPTETVYGLAGDIYCLNALKQIFQIKKRPLFDPLIVHFSNKNQLRKLCKYDSPIVEKLSDFFHPGPLTLVLRKKSVVSDLITAGSNKVAVRIPHHPLTLQLIKTTGCCLAAPSANLFSKISPTRARHVMDSLKIPVLDGGPCLVGIESTILEVIEDKKILSILRPGVIGKNELHNFLKRNQLDWLIQQNPQHNKNIPGQSPRHYQPDRPFILFKSSREQISKEQIEEKIKEFYPNSEPQELKLKGDPYIFGRELYHNLRQLSKNERSVGYVVQNINNLFHEEVWPAIWDRIEKASSQIISLN